MFYQVVIIKPQEFQTLYRGTTVRNLWYHLGPQGPYQHLQNIHQPNTYCNILAKHLILWSFGLN